MILGVWFPDFLFRFCLPASTGSEIAVGLWKTYQVVDLCFRTFEYRRTAFLSTTSAVSATGIAPATKHTITATQTSSSASGPVFFSPPLSSPSFSYCLRLDCLSVSNSNNQMSRRPWFSPYFGRLDYFPTTNPATSISQQRFFSPTFDRSANLSEHPSTAPQHQHTPLTLITQKRL